MPADESMFVSAPVPVSQRIKNRLNEAGASFFASDNISEWIREGEMDELIDELESKFGAVLNSLIIDTDNDPNSMGTGRRLAKMYVKELMVGRYTPSPAQNAAG